MEPHSTFWSLFLLSVRNQVSVIAITQALIVAGMTAAITTYATTKALESEMQFIKTAIERHETQERKLGEQMTQFAIKQAGAIANGEAVHTNHEQRLQVLEKRR